MKPRNIRPWLPLCAALLMTGAAHAQRAAKDVVLDQVAAPLLAVAAPSTRSDAMVVSVLVESPDGTLRPRSTNSLFRTGAKLSLYQGNGPGGLMKGRQMAIDLGKYDWSVGVSDVGLTGHADVIVRKRGTGQLFLLQGSTKGFAKPVLLGTGMGIYDKAT